MIACLRYRDSHVQLIPGSDWVKVHCALFLDHPTIDDSSLIIEFANSRPLSLCSTLGAPKVQKNIQQNARNLSCMFYFGRTNVYEFCQVILVDKDPFVIHVCLTLHANEFNLTSWIHFAKYLPPIHDRNLYLAKRWYRRAMQHNRGVQDYIDNHTNDNCNIRCSRNTPLELIRNLHLSRQATSKRKCYTTTISTFGQRSLWLAYEKIPLSSFFFLYRNPKNCKHKKEIQKNI